VISLATLKYIGKPVQNDTGNPTQVKDLVDKDYVNTLLAANMTQSAVTSRITSNLSGFATQSFAASSMASLVTQAQVRAADAAYAAITNIGQPNGPIALSGLGQISPGLITATSTQQWPTPLYSPTAYQNVNVVTDSPLQLFTMAQPYPGYPYVLECTGIMDAQVPLTDSPTVLPQILIRQGSATGPIIAFGYGVGESYSWGQAPLGVQSTAQLGSGSEWAQYYNQTGFGTWCTATAGIAGWNQTGGDALATCRCRCLDPVFGTTTTSYQQISTTVGSPANNNGNSNAFTDIFARMDDTGTYYVHCGVGANQAYLTYSLGGTEVAIGTPITSGLGGQQTGDVFTLNAGNFATKNLRQFQLFLTRGATTTLLATWNDTNNASALGTAYQGWGFGGTTNFSTTFFFTTQWFPAPVTAVTIVDPANPAGGINSGTVVILPAPLAGQTANTGPVTLFVMLQSSDTSGAVKEVQVSPFLPGLSVVPIPWSP
jgi:hypothetical protein